MYTWIWDHLPGPAIARIAIFAAAIGATLVLVFAVVSPTLQSWSSGSSDEGGPTELNDVTEPDGVRSSPRPVAPQPDPAPVVPEDALVPQP